MTMLSRGITSVSPILGHPMAWCGVNTGGHRRTVFPLRRTLRVGRSSVQRRPVDLEPCLNILDLRIMGAWGRLEKHKLVGGFNPSLGINPLFWVPSIGVDVAGFVARPHVHTGLRGARSSRQCAHLSANWMSSIVINRKLRIN